MSTSYKTITPIQIGNLLHILAAGEITWMTARVWFACLEMVAIREAAQRVRRLKQDKRRVEPHFKRSELMELTGLNARAVGKAAAAIRRCGLASLAPKAITVADSAMPDASETIRSISGRRSPKRPIPFPRTLLRFLAMQPKAALGKVILGYVCRGLSIDREGGGIRGTGTVKAGWLADTLGLSLRSVRYAQAELRRVGWIPKDTGSKQRKLNRHGAWFRISLDWRPATTGGEVFGGGSVALPGIGIAPLQPVFSTPVASPKEDLKTPSESKNQKPGVFGTGIGKASTNSAKTLPPATLANIRLADLHDRERLRSLHRQAIARGWLLDCEADTLNFFGAAVRARSTAARDPVRVFVDIVRKRRWNHVTQAHEEEGRRQFKDAPVSPRTPDGRCTPIGAVLKSLIAQGRPGQGIERCGSLPASRLGVDWSHGRQDHLQSKSMRRTSVHPRNEDSGERRS